MDKTTKTILTLVVLGIVIIGVGFLIFQEKPNKKNEITKVKIAYLPVVNSLPLFLAVEKGYFKEEGIEVEAVKFESPNQIIDALLAGNVDFGAPSTPTGITAISQFRNPNTLKIFALVGTGSDSSANIDNHLIIRVDSKISRIKELKGKKLGIIPGIQHRTTAKHILSSEGLDSDKDVTLVELPIPLQIQALTSGQVDALLALEPVGTIGRTKNITKDLVVNPLGKYVADPWYGGGGIVPTKFEEENPQTTKKVIKVFDRAIKDIDNNPEEARQYLKDYTPLTDDLVTKVPLPVWKMYTDFTKKDIDALQKIFDIFTRWGVIEGRIDAKQLIYSK